MLKKTMKVNGGLRTPAWFDEDSGKLFTDKETALEFEAEQLYKYNQELRDTSIVLTEFMRAFSVVYKVLDLSSLDPELKAGIDKMVATFEQFPLPGDAVFYTSGNAALEDMLQRQNDLLTKLLDITGDANITDVYAGIKKLGE
jgi:hypothetical protein